MELYSQILKLSHRIERFFVKFQDNFHLLTAVRELEPMTNDNIDKVDLILTLPRE